MNYRIIFLIIFLFRIFFALNVNLIDDEAYHWSWSKELMLSYYDHPGMIAWLNFLSTSLFGDTLLGIRLPSFIFYSLTVLFSWKLAVDMFNEKVAFFVSMLLLWTPFWGFGGYVNSPEPVFFFSWMAASWVFWQSVREDEKKWSAKKSWLILGVLMGVGLNSKFIIAMLAFGFGVYLLVTAKDRKVLLSRWPWIGFFIATMLALPIFIWNYHYDWPGFKYQFHDRHTGESLSVSRWVTWFTTQFVFYTPPVFILILLSIWYSIKNFHNQKIRFLFSLALPSYLVFYIQPLFADYKPHWSGTASIFMVMIVGHLLQTGFSINNFEIIKPTLNSTSKNNWQKSILFFLIPLNIFIYSPFAYPYFPKVYKFFSSAPWNTQYDLSNEFFGWEPAGEYLKKRQREIHSDSGKKPFLAAIRYETTAQTIWGTKNPDIVMINKFVSHYTVVQKKNHRLDKFQNNDALILTTEKYNDNPMEFGYFDSCSKEEFKFYREEELSRTFYIWHCLNFRGVQP